MSKRWRPKNMEVSFLLILSMIFMVRENWGKYKEIHRIVKTNLFGNRSVHAYVTSSSKGAR